MGINVKMKTRITKLLALSNSPNDFEASSALLKAKLLLAQHGLNLEDFSDEQSNIEEIIITSTDGFQPWKERLLKYIAETTFTEILKISDEDKKSFKIVGRESNIISANILFDYLKETIENRAVIFKESIEDIESFCIGIVESINQKFKEKMKQEVKFCNSKEIVLKIERNRKIENLDFIKRKYGNPETSDNWYGVDPNSYGLGKAIGKKIPINTQLSSEGTKIEDGKDS